MAKRAPKKSEEQSLDFEQALGDLEGLVERMERGDLSLEQSLAEFEQGINLTRRCQQALAEAEQKVQILLGDGEMAPFEEDAE